MVNFKVGDLVQVKSGGPKMTVNDADDSDQIQCQWFSGTKLHSGYFNANSLQKFVEKPDERK